MNSSGNKKFWQPMRMLHMHSRCLVFSFFLECWVEGGGGKRGGIFLFCLFPMCFHSVPINFSKGSLHAFYRTFPIAPPFYPILFGHSLPFMYLKSQLMGTDNGCGPFKKRKLWGHKRACSTFSPYLLWFALVR